MTPSSELRVEQINPASINTAETLWNSVDMQGLDAEKQKELVSIRNGAFNQICRIRVMLQNPAGNAEEQLLNAGRKMNELWERARGLLASRYTSLVAGAVGAENADSIEAVLSTDRENARVNIEEKSAPGQIAGELESIGTRLSADPSGLLEGESIDSFFRTTGGMVVPNIQKIEKSRVYLQDVVKNAELRRTHPALVSHAEKLLKGLETLRAAAPRETEFFDWHQSRHGKVDWRPLRGLGLLAGGLITAVGLHQTLNGKGFSPATAFWAAIAGLSYKPDMFKSVGKVGLDKLAFLGSGDMRKALCLGFRGEKGKAAFEELQELSEDPEKVRTLKGLMKNDVTIEPGLLASFLGSVDSAAYTILEKMSPEDRKRMLLLLGRKKGEDDRALISEYMLGAP
ncbi:MAG: hypothetical protein ABL890_02385 [Candidatus Peribacteraceae bacterium]